MTTGLVRELVSVNNQFLQWQREQADLDDVTLESAFRSGWERCIGAMLEAGMLKVVVSGDESLVSEQSSESVEHGVSAPLVEDQLRQRWLLAMAKLGREGAFQDAVDAWMVLLGCSSAEAREIVKRAWSTLAFRSGATFD